jgi:CheY-like chemotaxis protein
MMNTFRNILIIDDDYVSNAWTELELKNGGLAEHVEIAHHGEEGLEKLLNGTKFDLILLDFNMPVMNGFEFLKRLRSLNLSSEPKVVILTSSHDPKEIEIANEFNVVGFINKPFYVSKILPIIKNSILKE